MTVEVEHFLSGMPVAVEPAAIERELCALWKPASESSAENPSDAVMRVCLANVVLVGRSSDRSWQSVALHKLSASYPCRILWVEVDDRNDGPLKASVTALCHLPSPGQPQICSELIHLETGLAGLHAVPGAVLPLLEADLPVALWWALGAQKEQSLLRSLSKLADRVILHSVPMTSPFLRTAEASPCLRLCLQPGIKGKATVLVWHAMSPWRELTAQFFDDPQVRSFLPNVERVCIRYATPTNQPMATLPAALYVGWFAGQLGWEPRSRKMQSDGLHAALSTRTGRTVEVELTAETTDQVAQGRIMVIDIFARSGEVDASFHLQRIVSQRMEIRQIQCVTGACTHLRSLPITERHEGILLGAALESQSHTGVFPRSAEVALWLMGTESAPIPVTES